jgi:hypothetical protein
MKSFVFGGLAVATAAVAAAGASAVPSPGHPVSITLSSAKAGARNVGLTLRMPTVLQCGHPRGGPVVLTLPRATSVPQKIGVAAVTVNGKPASAVGVKGRAVTVGLPVPHGMICDSLVDGTLQIAIAPSAALRNPAKPGTYTATVQQGHESWTVPVSVR